MLETQINSNGKEICSLNTSPIPLPGERLQRLVKWPRVRAELGHPDLQGWGRVLWSSGAGAVHRGLGQRAAQQELRTAVRGWEILLVISVAVVLGVSLLSSTPHSLSSLLPVPLPQGASEVARRSPDHHLKYSQPPTQCSPSSLLDRLQDRVALLSPHVC